jgi:hypothetical protein
MTQHGNRSPEADAYGAATWFFLGLAFIALVAAAFGELDVGLR